MTGKVKLVSAGGGSVSFATPSTSSNRTVTLPTHDVTLPATATAQGDILYASAAGVLANLVKGTAGHVLTMNSGGTLPEWAAAAAGGKILQYVYATDNTNVTESSGSAAEVVDATITPAHTDNKILVLGKVSGSTNPSSNAFVGGHIRRGGQAGTQISNFASGHNGNSIEAWAFHPWVLDSPSTTSAQEYTITIQRDSGSTASVTTDSSTNQILLVELAA